MPGAPPLTSARVAVQHIRPAMFSDLQRRQFEEFFPFFFEPAAPPPETDPPIPVSREAAYHLRRFSGGANLERGRYFALIDVADVDQRGGATTMVGTSALVGELLAYSHDWTLDWTATRPGRCGTDPP